MVTARTQQGGVLGRFEPELQHTVFPGCRECGGAHPSVRKPIMPAETCPDCGTPAQPPGPTVITKAALTGWRGIVAGTCFSISRGLAALLKKV